MVTVNGHPNDRYIGNLNVSFAHVEGESLLMVSVHIYHLYYMLYTLYTTYLTHRYLSQALKNIAVSSGSACTSASLEPSYVLRALGADAEQAHSSIRFGLGRFTTEAEVDLTLYLLEKHVSRLREMVSSIYV